MDSDENEIDTHSAASENRSGVSEANVVLIKEFEQSLESSSYSDSSEEEQEAAVKKEQKNPGEVASIYSHIQKLIRYLKVSGGTRAILKRYMVLGVRICAFDRCESFISQRFQTDPFIPKHIIAPISGTYLQKPISWFAIMQLMMQNCYLIVEDR